MAGKGTGHHRLHGWSGLVTIFSLPLVLWGLMGAIPGGGDGFKSWVSSGFGAASLFVFMSAALWYCKLEFDAVIMDYTDGGLQKFGVFANVVVAMITWVIAVYAIYSIWSGA